MVHIETEKGEQHKHTNYTLANLIFESHSSIKDEIFFSSSLVERNKRKKKFEKAAIIKTGGGECSAGSALLFRSGSRRVSFAIVQREQEETNAC